MNNILANVKTGIITLCVILSIVSFGFSYPARAQSPLDEAKALNAQVIELHRAGNAGEAIPLAKRALALLEKAKSVWFTSTR